MKEHEHKYKTFLKAYETINKDHRAFKSYQNDKRLSQHEKKLLQSLLLLKKSKPKECIQELNNLNVSINFLDGFKSFILGLSYLHIGKFSYSSKSLVNAIRILRPYEIEHVTLKPIHVLARVYFNLNELERLKKYYNVFLELGLHSPKYELINLEYQIFISHLENDKEKCFGLIDKLCSTQTEFIKFDLPFYEILRFRLHAKNQDFEACYESYQRYCNLNGYKAKSNQKFIITLLNHITKNEKIYVYQNDYEDNIYLFYQLKVLRSLELSNIDEAKEFWSKLMQLSPDLYSKNFKFNGDTELFSIALERFEINDQINNSEVTPESLTPYKTAIKKLKFILENSQGFIDKYTLIELIWNEEWTPKNDSRLRTLIYRLKKDSSISITTQDGKYKKSA